MCVCCVVCEPGMRACLSILVQETIFLLQEWICFLAEIKRPAKVKIPLWMGAQRSKVMHSLVFTDHQSKTLDPILATSLHHPFPSTPNLPSHLHFFSHPAFPTFHIAKPSIPTSLSSSSPAPSLPFLPFACPFLTCILMHVPHLPGLHMSPTPYS